MHDVVNYLRKHVPLSRHMDISAGELNNKWFELRAPLRPNINDKQTAFGGALATLCTLSGWCIPFWLCQKAGLKVDLVILSSDIRYRLPSTTDPIIARAYLPSTPDQSTFMENLQSQGTGRLSIDAHVLHNEKPAVLFSAQYHARLIKQSEQ